MLLTMRNRIADILSVFPEDVDETEVSYTQEISSAPPPAEISETSKDETHFRVEEEDTRKRSDEPEHTPEAVSAWSNIEERLIKPQVQTVQIELLTADPSPDEHLPDSESDNLEVNPCPT
jgi:hypothetical protein